MAASKWGPVPASVDKAPPPTPNDQGICPGCWLFRGLLSLEISRYRTSSAVGALLPFSSLVARWRRRAVMSTASAQR
jgi:hypothetical protein